MQSIGVKKRFFTFNILVTFFYVFNVFCFPNVFFIFKETLANLRAASRLTRSTFKITAMKQTYDFFCCMSNDLKCLLINLA